VPLMMLRATEARRRGKMFEAPADASGRDGGLIGSIGRQVHPAHNVAIRPWLYAVRTTLAIVVGIDGLSWASCCAATRARISSHPVQSKASNTIPT
jgi:hypothetical protein